MSRSNPQPELRRSITDRNARIGFGKYAAETVQDILDCDPGYLIWLDSQGLDIACNILTEAQENLIPDHAFKNWTQRT